MSTETVRLIWDREKGGGGGGMEVGGESVKYQVLLTRPYVTTIVDWPAEQAGR